MSGMSELRVNEIFHSIQGEGHFTGTQATFVRFQGCSVGCSWCDTKHTWAFDAGERMEPGQIAARVRRRHVVFTGGEPVQQPRGPMLTLVRTLRAEGRFVQVETSGRFFAPWLAEADWRTVSPKPPDYTIHPELLPLMDEMKVVVCESFDISRLPDPAPEGCIVSLQPEGNRREMVERAMACLKARPDWRLSLQMHKIAGLA